jgi:hypothetical protein
MLLLREQPQEPLNLENVATYPSDPSDAGDCHRIGPQVVPFSMCVDESKWGSMEAGGDFETAFSHWSSFFCSVIVAIKTETDEAAALDVNRFAIRDLARGADDGIVDVEHFGREIINGEDWELASARLVEGGARVSYDFYTKTVPEFGTVHVMIFVEDTCRARTEDVRRELVATFRVARG